MRRARRTSARAAGPSDLALARIVRGVRVVVRALGPLGIGPGRASGSRGRRRRPLLVGVNHLLDLVAEALERPSHFLGRVLGDVLDLVLGQLLDRALRGAEEEAEALLQ